MPGRAYTFRSLHRDGTLSRGVEGPAGRARRRGAQRLRATPSDGVQSPLPSRLPATGLRGRGIARDSLEHARATPRTPSSGLPELLLPLEDRRAQGRLRIGEGERADVAIDDRTHG